MRNRAGIIKNFLSIIALILGGCGVSPAPVSTSPTTVGCDTGAAQIGVGDGYLSVLCGCQEKGGAVTLPPSKLTCTVHQGTYVFFHYIGPTLNHQIISNGQPSFDPGPLSISHNSNIVRTHVVHLTTTGTYSFIDSQEGVLAGQIIVQ